MFACTKCSINPWTLMPRSENSAYVFDIWSSTDTGAVGGPQANNTNNGVVPAASSNNYKEKCYETVLIIES